MDALQAPLNQAMTRHVCKTERMDALVRNTVGKLDGDKICRIVHEAFGIDYRKVPVQEKKIGRLVKGRINPSVSAIDLYLATHKRAADGPAIRKMMNALFGTSLEDIDCLSRTRISLFSKGQWIARKERDLFEIHTGFADVNVKVIPSAFFTAQTDLHTLPRQLEQALAALGYQHNDHINAYYYCHPGGKVVPEHFKHETVEAIIAVTDEYFGHL